MSNLSVSHALRLSHVRRWGIIATTREQSVAEHSYNVAVIVDKIHESIGSTASARATAISKAVYHDFDEIDTGDIPSSSKTQKPFPENTSDKILKVADTIEAYAFLRLYGTGIHAESVKRELRERIMAMVRQCEQNVAIAVMSIMGDIDANY